jgi:hypothetical protein
LVALDLVASWACAGCASTPKPHGAPYPPWVVQGSALVSDDEQAFFDGVGQSSLQTPPEAALRVAERDATAATAVTFQVFWSRLFGLWARERAKAEAEPDAEPVSQTESQPTDGETKPTPAKELDLSVWVTYDVERLTLQTTTVVDRFLQPASGVWYARARLTLAAFLAALQQSQDLEPEAKDFLAAHAAEVHKTLLGPVRIWGR